MDQWGEGKQEDAFSAGPLHGSNTTYPTVAPPAYESVVMSTQHHHQPATESPFEITVTDPVKQGDGVSAYVSYKVRTKTTLQHFRNQNPEVIRRFRDFAWLQQRLQEQNKGVIVPPVPEKNAVQKYQMQAHFIEQRRAALQIFINRVAAHPVLGQSKELQLFLEATEEEWAMEVSRASFEVNGGAKKKLAGALQAFRDLGQSTAQLMSGKSYDDEEDPEYLKVRDYVFQLEVHLAEAQRQAARLLKQQRHLGHSLSEFGTSMSSLGKFETGALADSFMRTGEKAEVLSKQCNEHAAQLSASFEAPLREFVRLVKSAKATMSDRSLALAALQHARGDVDAKRTNLMKLRGTPGIREEKVAEAERDLNEAQFRAERAKGEYETIVARMSEELQRFQADRAVEMGTVLRDFAVAQAHLAAESAKVWRSLVPEANGVHN